MPIKIESKIKAFSVGAVVAEAPVVAAPVATAQEPDRRLVLGQLPGIAEQSLRFPKRPTNAAGFEAWTSDFVRAPDNRKFALCVSHYRNGHLHPFEIWALGQEQPSAASLICQLLSKVLQTDDRAFIRHHLDALKKAVEQPFDITMPYTGEVVRAGSVGAAIALIYEAHARHIGYLGDQDADANSPMLSAMSSIREPKSQGQGGYATFDDVRNGATGDDFPVFIKEAWLPGENQPLPISLWFGTRKVPKESEAILKLASMAMRHRDPAWTATLFLTLRKHAVFGEELGFAQVGTRKPAYYPSTWAYVADLVLYRYQQLGILDEDGQPLAQRSLFAPADTTSDVPATADPFANASLMTCPECRQTGSIMMQGGCPTCACGWSKC